MQPRSSAAILEMRLDRNGTMSVTLEDGATVTAPLDSQAFAPTSLIREIVYIPAASQLKFCTTRNDEFFIELPQPHDPAPLRGRPTIYLDQNHWSTSDCCDPPARACHQCRRTPSGGAAHYSCGRQ